MTRSMILVIGLIALCGPRAWATPAGAARFKALRSEGERALRSLQRDTRIQAHWQVNRTRPSLIVGLFVQVAGTSDVARARRFISQHPGLFIDATGELKLVDERAGRDLRVIRFQQRHCGLVVEGSTISVALDGAGLIRSVRSDVEPIPPETPISPRISADAAVAALTAAHRIAVTPRTSSAELVILPGATPRLAYKLALPGLLPSPPDAVHFIDAVDGRYLGSRRGVIHLRAPAAVGEVRR